MNFKSDFQNKTLDICTNIACEANVKISNNRIACITIFYVRFSCLNF